MVLPAFWQYSDRRPSRATRPLKRQNICYSLRISIFELAGFMKFIHELRRRRVFQTAAIYIVAAWIILQVADLAFPGLDIPENAIRYVWIGAFLGFPIALVFGWRYQITSQGIVRTAPLASG